MSDRDSNPFALNVPVTGRDHSLGPADAPVTLVEYGDFECGHCGRAHPILQALGREMGARLRFVFRHFPLTQHPHAIEAAEAAEAAGAQGRFWEMHDWLFEHQDELDRRGLVAGAASLGLDLDRFEGDLDGHVHLGRVREDLEGGLAGGVNGTPAFYLNGRRHLGGYDLESLREAAREAQAGGEAR